MFAKVTGASPSRRPLKKTRLSLLAIGLLAAFCSAASAQQQSRVQLSDGANARTTVVLDNKPCPQGTVRNPVNGVCERRVTNPGPLPQPTIVIGEGPPCIQLHVDCGTDWRRRDRVSTPVNRDNRLQTGPQDFHRFNALRR